MRVLPEPVEFEWDKGNKDKSYIKHAVSNKEAEEVFMNKPSFIFHDTKHSHNEKRYMIWGFTNKGKKLSIFFTFRNKRVRIISARDMHKKERSAYEKKAQTNTSV